VAAFKALQDVDVELLEYYAMPETSTKQTRPRVGLFRGYPSRSALHDVSYLAELIGTDGPRFRMIAPA